MCKIFSKNPMSRKNSVWPTLMPKKFEEGYELCRKRLNTTKMNGFRGALTQLFFLYTSCAMISTRSSHHQARETKLPGFFSQPSSLYVWSVASSSGKETQPFAASKHQKHQVEHPRCALGRLRNSRSKQKTHPARSSKQFCHPKTKHESHRASASRLWCCHQHPLLGSM